MKKLIIGAIVLLGFSIVSNAQTVSAKKAAAPKMQIVKNSSTKTSTKVLPITKPVTTMPAKTYVVKTEAKKMTVIKTAPTTTTTKVVVKPAVVTKTNTSVMLKKDGTPDKRFKTTTTHTVGPVKKDGTPDMRYKANKKP